VQTSSSNDRASEPAPGASCVHTETRIELLTQSLNPQNDGPTATYGWARASAAGQHGLTTARKNCYRNQVCIAQVLK
jgi:hypothetical protein